MSEQTTEIIKREVGEHVNVVMSLEPASTKELADGVFETVVTTSVIDRQGESITTQGITTDTWMKNPVVLYGHDYQGLPIGKGLSISQTKNKMKSKFQLAVEEYPFAATVAALIKGGYLNAVSIGGIVRKWSEDYRVIEELEMVEFSIVPVPANPDALITSRSLEEATGKSMAVIKREFQEFTHKSMLDSVSGMGDDEVNGAIKVLEGLVATLKESAKAASIEGETKVEVKRIGRITLRDSAKAVATQSQRVIKTIKLKSSKE